MKNQHTPGPWVLHETYVEGGKNAIRTADFQWIAFCPRRAVIDAEKDANARLISAAPELLQIAKAYRNLLKTMATTDGEVATFEYIEGVILKAEGGE